MPTRLLNSAIELLLRKEEERRYRRIADRFGYFSWTLDAAGRPDFFNRCWCEYVGLPLEKLLKSDWTSFFHPEDRAIARCALDGALRLKTEWRGEVRVRRKDGVYRWFSIILLPRFSSIGRLISWYASAIDVEERRRAESARAFLSRAGQALAKSLDFCETLRAAAQLAVSGISDWAVVCAVESRDPFASPQCVTAAAKGLPGLDSALTACGLKALESLEGKAKLISELRDEDLLRLAFSDSERVRELKSAQVSSALIVPLRSAGRSFSGVLIGLEQAPRIFGPDDLCLIEDFSQRVISAVENACSYRQAVDAIRAREEIIAVVSHDLKNPLNAIRLNAGLLNRFVKEKRLPPELGRHSELIEKAAGQMARLIEGILDLSKLEGGRVRLDRRIDFADRIVNEVLELMRPQAAEKSIELSGPPHRPPFCELFCDHDRIIQVLSNLLGNAIKFTQPGGKVSVGFECAGGDALFSVSDNGPGIPAKALPHIFDRYWQARETAQKGTGLGLSIARGFVEAHGGRIWVRSAEGHGTTFYFTIPTRAAAAA